MIPNDFRIQSLYGRGRDWPIGYDDLEQYYNKAELELGVTGTDGQDESGQGGGPMPPRSMPFPMKQLNTSYMFDMLAQKLACSGWLQSGAGAAWSRLAPLWQPSGLCWQ